MKYLLTLVFLLISYTSYTQCNANIEVNFTCKTVEVFSSKDVSHIIINDTIKFDNLKIGPIFSYSGIHIISNIVVKSGCTVQYFENNNCDVLPVILSTYEIKDSIFRWVTEIEINSDYFLIESYEGDQYKIKANGNSVVQNTYEHPLTKSGYYRLIEVDYDGNKTYYKYLVYTKEESTYKPVYDIIGRQIK